MIYNSSSRIVVVAHHLEPTPFFNGIRTMSRRHTSTVTIAVVALSRVQTALFHLEVPLVFVAILDGTVVDT